MKQKGRDSNVRPIACTFDDLITKLPRHTHAAEEHKAHSVVAAHLSGIENIHDLLEHWNPVVLMLLTKHLNVTQLSKVEVSFFLQRVNCLLRLLQLDTQGVTSTQESRQHKESCQPLTSSVLNHLYTWHLPHPSGFHPNP